MKKQHDILLYYQKLGEKMDWKFLFNILTTLLIVYILSILNLAWIGLIICAIIIWSQEDDLKSMSIFYTEQKEEIERLKDIIKKY